MKKITLASVMSGIHYVFVLSILCFGTIYISLGILALPALTSAFIIGRDVIFGQFDIYDSLFKRFFTELKVSAGMMRYFPLQLLAMLQGAGMFAAERLNIPVLPYVMLVCMVFIITLLIYIAAYCVFCTPKPAVTETVIVMFYRIGYMIMIWLSVLLITVTLCKLTLIIGLFAGAAILLAAEITAFLDIISYKKLRGLLTEQEKERLGEKILNKL